jgi:hypothetical protein
LATFWQLKAIESLQRREAHVIDDTVLKHCRWTARQIHSVNLLTLQEGSLNNVTAHVPLGPRMSTLIPVHNRFSIAAALATRAATAFSHRFCMGGRRCYNMHNAEGLCTEVEPGVGAMMTMTPVGILLTAQTTASTAVLKLLPGFLSLASTCQWPSSQTSPKHCLLSPGSSSCMVVLAGGMSVTSVHVPLAGC